MGRHKNKKNTPNASLYLALVAAMTLFSLIGQRTHLISEQRWEKADPPQVRSADVAPD